MKHVIQPSLARRVSPMGARQSCNPFNKDCDHFSIGGGSSFLLRKEQNGITKPNREKEESFSLF